MALSFGNSVANSMLDTITTRVDAGSAAGLIKIYAGTAPPNAGSALSGNTLLGTLTCSDPSAASASSKVLTFSSITQDTSADATGDATFFRITDSDANVVIQGSITAVGGGGDLQLNSVSIVAAGPIQITSCAFTLP